MKTKMCKTWKEQFKIYGKKFPMVKCGSGHTLILLENGNLYSCGDNRQGQLGLRDHRSRNTLHKVPLNKKIIQISAGSRYSLALSDYKVYSCGSFDYVRAGLFDYFMQKRFQLIKPLKGKKIIQIECSTYHAYALTVDGFVFSWGADNQYGQLGHNDKKPRFTPTLIQGIPKFKKISSGGYHTMAISGNQMKALQRINLKIEKDEVFVWGSNIFGELGLGDLMNRLKPEFHPYLNSKKVKKVSFGTSHSLALFENGEIYSWGRNNLGQLGHGDEEDRNVPTLISFFKSMNVLDLFAISNGSFVLLENGAIYTFGNNQLGQLALGFFGCTQKVPTMIGDYFQNEKVVNIEGGPIHTFFITESGKIYGVGSNSFGKLGFPQTDDLYIPRLLSYKP